MTRVLGKQACASYRSTVWYTSLKIGCLHHRHSSLAVAHSSVLGTLWTAQASVYHLLLSSPEWVDQGWLGSEWCPKNGCFSCRWARRMCSARDPGVGGSLSTPWSGFICLNRSHLRSLACETFTLGGQKSTHRNASQPSVTFVDGSSPRPRLMRAEITLGFAAMKVLKHVTLPFPLMFPVVSHLVSACQLMRARAS